MRSFDQSRQIGDDKCASLSRSGIRISGNDAQMRLESGEGIRGDFGACRGNARDERGLSRIRETDEADVREQLEFEPQMALLARTPVLMFARRLMPRAHKRGMAVAAPAVASARREVSLARLGEIE